MSTRIDETRDSLVASLHKRVFLPSPCYDDRSAVRECAADVELATLPVPVLQRLKDRLEAGEPADFPYRKLFDRHRCCRQSMYQLAPADEWICGRCGRIETEEVTGWEWEEDI